METLKTKPAHNTREYWSIVTDVLSQAITGEIIGMANFAALTAITDDVHEMMEAVEHAASERGHAIGFMKMADKYELKVNLNIAGTYWNAVRESFLKWAGKRDYTACLLIQEIMLESFAISMYRDVGGVIEGEIGELFTKLSEEEESHLEHAVEFLRTELEKDTDGFLKKARQAHLDCMTVLSEMSAAPASAAQCAPKGHCGVCSGNCVKHGLPVLGLTTSELRGRALNFYMKSLDRIGVPGEKSLEWVANLPI